MEKEEPFITSKERLNARAHTKFSHVAHAGATCYALHAVHTRTGGGRPLSETLSPLFVTILLSTAGLALEKTKSGNHIKMHSTRNTSCPEST